MLGLIWTLVRTDFKTRYQPTIGGFVWALMKPVAMFVVLMSVFSFIFGGDPEYRFNLIVGLFLWDFFTEATKTGLVSLHARAYLLTKTRLRAWILVLTSASNATITLAVFCVVFLTFLVFSGRAPSGVGVALFGLYILQFVAVTVGLSLASSVMFLRYRDLNQIWDLVTQAGFFLAPIVYPLSIIPERFHLFLYLWPPTPFIQFSRAVLIEGTVPTLRAHLFLALEACAILAIGVVIFRRLAPRAAEYL
jgi:lipopolysaccharide transport system permease protein